MSRPVTVDDGSGVGARPPEPDASVTAAPRRPVRRRSRAGRRRSGRSLLERVTPAMVVGVLAAMLAFVLVAGVLRDRRATTTVVVPLRPIPAGELVTAESVRFVHVPADKVFSDGLLTATDLGSATMVAGRALPAGEPITRSAVGAGSGRVPARVIALPLTGWGDAGGELAVGDLVDVIDARPEVPVFVVQGAAVVGRSGSETGSGLGAGSRQVWVSIEVTAEQALQVAAVVEANKFVVVRSTGVTVGS